MYYVRIESTVDELDSAGLVESSDKTEVSCPVSVSEWGGAITLSYSEKTDGGEVNSLITVKPDSVTVSRTGAIESEFFFREGEKNNSLYKIPPYSFDAEIYTKKIRNNLSAEGGVLTVIYNMALGGGNKSVRMKITRSGGNE